MRLFLLCITEISAQNLTKSTCGDPRLAKIEAHWCWLLSTLLPHCKFLSFLRHSEEPLNCAPLLWRMAANAALTLSSDVTLADGTVMYELWRPLFFKKQLNPPFSSLSFRILNLLGSGWKLNVFYVRSFSTHALQFLPKLPLRVTGCALGQMWIS